MVSGQFLWVLKVQGWFFIVPGGFVWLSMVPGGFVWLFMVPGEFFMVPSRFLWSILRVDFSWFQVGF